MKLSEYSESSAGIVGSPKRVIRRSSGHSGRSQSRRRSVHSNAARNTTPVPKVPSRIPAAPWSSTTTSQTVTGIVASTLSAVSAK